MEKTYILHKNNIGDFSLNITQPLIIYLRGDLGAGKTTLSGELLSQLLGVKQDYTSPTYVYYNRYKQHFHFDLYRLNNYEEFIQIGGEEIFDNNVGVILVEWPDIVVPYYTPDVEIYIKKTSHDDEREVRIVSKDETILLYF